MCVFLSTKKAGRVQLRLPHSSSRAGCPESLNPHLETRKPPAHIFFATPTGWRAGGAAGLRLDEASESDHIIGSDSREDSSPSCESGVMPIMGVA